MAGRVCKLCSKTCGVLTAGQKAFHDAPDGEGFLCAECFVCRNCKKEIDEGDGFFTLGDGTFQCSACEEGTREKCTACGKVFEAGYVEVEHGKFHTECFACAECKNSIAGDYKQKDDGTFICRKCFAESCSQCGAKITTGRKNAKGEIICLECAQMPSEGRAPSDADLSMLKAKAQEEAPKEEAAPATAGYDGSSVDAARAAFLASSAETSAGEKAAAERAAAEKAEADKLAAEAAAVKAAKDKLAREAAAEKAAAERVEADKARARADVGSSVAAKAATAAAIASTATANKEVAAPAATSNKDVAADPIAQDARGEYVPPILTLAELQDDSVWKAKGVHPAKRELSLCDADFKANLGMDKETFLKAPKWKQESLKKNLKIF